jgi:hypothetical protein
VPLPVGILLRVERPTQYYKHSTGKNSYLHRLLVVVRCTQLTYMYLYDVNARTVVRLVPTYVLVQIPTYTSTCSTYICTGIPTYVLRHVDVHVVPT